MGTAGIKISNAIRNTFPLLIVLLFSGCSISIHNTYDKQVDFSKYKTFCWMSGCEFKINGPAYLNDSLLSQRLQVAVVDELSKKGLVQNTDNPDLLVGFTITVKDEQAIVYHPSEDTPIYITPLETDQEVINYLKGSLIIGMADNKDSRMVWQAEAIGYLETEPDFSEKNIKKGIKRVLKNYPPPKLANP